MHLDQVADRALVDQPLGGVVRAIPGERPVDREPPAGALHRRDHPPRIGDARREGLFDHDVEPVRRDLLDVVGMLGGRRADDGEIGLRRRQAGLEVGEDPVLGNAELRRSPPAIRARSGSKMPAISASGCSATSRRRSPMCMWSKLIPMTPCLATLRSSCFFPRRTLAKSQYLYRRNRRNPTRLLRCARTASALVDFLFCEPRGMLMFSNHGGLVHEEASREAAFSAVP